MVDLSYEVMAGNEAGFVGRADVAPGDNPWIWGRGSTRARKYAFTGIPGLSSQAIRVRHRVFSRSPLVTGVEISTQQGGPRSDGGVNVLSKDGRLLHRLTGYDIAPLLVPKGVYVVEVVVLETVCAIQLAVDVEPSVDREGTGTSKAWDPEQLLDDPSATTYMVAVLAVTLNRYPELRGGKGLHDSLLDAFTLLYKQKKDTLNKYVRQRCERDKIAVAGNRWLPPLVNHYEQKLTTAETVDMRDLLLRRRAQAQDRPESPNQF